MVAGREFPDPIDVPARSTALSSRRPGSRRTVRTPPRFVVPTRWLPSVARRSSRYPRARNGARRTVVVGLAMPGCGVAAELVGGVSLGAFEVVADGFLGGRGQRVQDLAH